MRRPTTPRVRRPALARRTALLSIALAGVLAIGTSRIEVAVAAAAPATQPGQATAQSSLLSVVVQSGGTSLLPTAVGEASASYVEAESQASSATVDPGGLGFLLSAIPICGVTLLPTSRQPQPLTADSIDGASSQTSGGNVPGAGTESVQVAPSPESATATTEPVSQSLLGGAVDISGTATATVRYLADGTQESQSSVIENLSLAGGVVNIDGMRWTASRRIGPSPVSSASFSFGQVTIKAIGVPVKLPRTTPASTLVKTVNSLVGPSGLHLSLPKSYVDRAAGSTAIGPLQIHFAGSSADRALISPVAKQVIALQQIISGQSANGSDCTNIKNLIGNLFNPAATVDNIVVGIAEGAGSVDLDLGGASAAVQAATGFTNPFDQGPSAGGSSTGNADDGQSSSAGASGPGAGSGLPAIDTQGAPPLTTSGAPSGAQAGAPPVVAATARELAVRCVTTSPAGKPSCWAGLGAVVGGVTVLAAGAFALSDVAYGRRSRRRRRHGRNLA